MENVFDHTLLWQYAINFVTEYKFLASVVLLVVLHFFKKGLLRLRKMRISPRCEIIAA